MSKNIKLNDKDVYFLPLGGSEQFGVNLNLYAHGGKWLAVDCGIGFADHMFPGIDILLPDPTFIEDRREDLSGLIVTHAHEDHIGAVAHLWPRLQCPVYCTEFTAAILRKKISEAPQSKRMEIIVVRAGDTVDIGPFKVEFIHVAHSIPDTVALFIQTKSGNVLHSGDWNLDPHPVLSKPTDAEAFKRCGEKGVMAYVGDSTNADVPGRSGSEKDVEQGLAEVFKQCKGRIAITIFASNIGRIHSIAKAAKVAGRRVALIGRSLHTMTGAARDSGYLHDIPEFTHESEISNFAHDKQLLIVTGSQGEARAALARIARGENSNVKFGRGDTVIFSSRAIPGNEIEINIVRNNLVASGATVITHRDTMHTIHVSGHPCQDELSDMYQWIRPKLVVPVHGERTQLEAQAAWARKCQIDNVIVPANGMIIKLSGTPEIIDHVPTGLLAVEPGRILAADHVSISDRRKLQFSGVVHVTLVMDRRGELVAEPQVTTSGLIDTANDTELKVEEDLIIEIEDIIADMENHDRKDDHAVHEEVRIGVRRFVHMLMHIKPKTTVHVVRV
ncbi:MAG: ribonuclease J [Alphaproteobacteria bacterium]|nr:ribonuclease J [Alphaproteobacteria bacterium]